MALDNRESRQSGPQCLIVCGMHRSGTSMLSGCLHLLGMDLGRHLMPPSAGNESGHWENAEIALAHELLLRDLGCRWDMVGNLPEGWLDSEPAKRAHKRIAAIVERTFVGNQPWAVKDPRISRLLPLWFRILGDLDATPGFILMLRHPLEVALSLQKRNGFDLRKGHLLWFAYNRDALNALRRIRSLERRTEADARGETGKVFPTDDMDCAFFVPHSLDAPSVLVTYDEFLANPVAVLCEIERVMGFTFPRPVLENASAILDFVRPELRHHHKDNAKPQEDNAHAFSHFAWFYEHLRGVKSSDGQQPTEETATLANIVNELLGLVGDYERSEREVRRQKERRILAGTRPGDSLFAQVFFPSDHGSYDESRAARFLLPCSEWYDFSVPLTRPTVLRSHPLRIDPLNTRGVVIIRKIALVSAASAETLWKAETPEDFDGFRIQKDALRLPSPKGLFLMVSGSDPQLLLPPIPALPDEPMVLHVWLKAEWDQKMAAETWKEMEKRSARHQAEMEALRRDLERHRMSAERWRQVAEQAEKDMARREAEYGHAVADNTQLSTWLRKLHKDFCALKESKRRKAGNALIRFLKILVLRGREPLALDHMEKIFSEYAAWKEEKRRTPSNRGVTGVTRDDVYRHRHWMEQLQNDFDALQSSFRWRIGNALLRPLEILAFRWKVETAADHMRKIFAEFQAWRPIPGKEARDVECLRLWLRKLRNDVQALAHSHRWRLGNGIVTIIDYLLLRGRMPTAMDHMRAVLESFEKWDGDKAREKGTFRGTPECSTLTAHASTCLYELVLTPPDGEPQETDFPPDGSVFFEETGFLASVPYDRPVSIVIPVYNGLDDVRRCIQSIRRFTRCPFEMIIVDDASTETGVGDFLADLARDPRFKILRNERNMGFVASANRGMRASQHDVVLLNSDTQVTPRWLTKLKAAAYSSPDVATVTPFSNAAGAFSVPEAGRNSPLPLHLDLEEMHRIVERLSSHAYPSVPTGNGFCLYIKRSALDLEGFFDEKTFERGYGEENDLCMRFRARGLRSILDDATFIYHKGNASFGEEEKKALMQKHRVLINERHPEYTGLVRDFVHSEPINELRRRIGREMQGVDCQTQPNKRRLLYILHQGGGGVPHTTLDLVEKMAADHQCFLLTSDTKRLSLSFWSPDGLTTVKTWKPARPWHPEDLFNPEFLAVYREVLFSLKIELVHIRHLFKHTLDIFRACEELEVPVVVSFHDFYMLNPFVHLLDVQGRFHPEPVPAEPVLWHVPSGLLRTCPNTSAFVTRWREAFQNLLKNCQAFVTTSNGTRDVITSHYPFLKEAPFFVIEHGRDLPLPAGLGRPPYPHESVKILCLGNVDFHKGSALIAEMSRLNAQDGGPLEFHFLGTIDHHLKGIGHYHGRYKRETFLEHIKAIRPHFIAILSIWAETYSHTLTEAWVAGIPVIGSALGAVAERIERTGGGWVVDVTDPQKTYEQVRQIIADTEGYREKLDILSRMHFKTAGEMAVGYRWVYDEAEARARGERRPIRAAAFIPRGFNGSSYVRVLLPLSHPRVRRCLSSVVLRSDFAPEVLENFAAEMGLDAVLLQRDCLDAVRAETLLAMCRRRSIKTIFELDDDLFNISRDHTDHKRYRENRQTLETLARQCDRLFVSTPKIAASLEVFGREAKVIPNVLDERLWLRPVGRHESHAGGSNAPVEAVTAETVRILYMGTRTHGGDLRLIEQSVRRAAETLTKQYGLSLIVDLVGILPPGERPEMPFNVITVPSGFAYYPRFVRWLRSLGRWDFGIAPLAPTPLNECKSALKFFEYAALGIAGIFSPVGEYPVVVEDGVTGIVCPTNAPEEWEESLVKMAVDPDLRKRLAEGALARLRERFLLKNVADSYVELWRELCRNE
ncbi:MAG: glycosyltransferase [Desulfosoma sp.]